MSDFEGAGIDRPGLEHVGFQVENVETVKKELIALRDQDPDMRERIIAEPSEGERREALIATCRYCKHVTSSSGWGVCGYLGDLAIVSRQHDVRSFYAVGRSL